MCGKDGAQMGVYKLKEEHEERGIGIEKRRRKKDIRRKRRKKEKEGRIALVTKQNVRCVNFRTLRYLRVKSF